MFVQLSGATPGQTFNGISGAVYTADINGVVSITNPGDVFPLINSAGLIPFGSGASLRANFRNFLDGGDMTTNPAQRNIPGLASGGVISSAISNTVTYFADRWFGVGGASSSILFSLIADTNVLGFSQSLKFQRSSANSNVAVISMGQVLETGDCVHLQGQKITFSFWARAGANFSAAGNLISVQVASGTGTNQSAANLIAGSWTSQTNVINTTQALTSNMTRYQFTGTLPAGCTQIGVIISFTPVGTAGADDSIVVNGLQLEHGSVASDFERRDLEVELALCQRYCFVIAEPAAGVSCGAGGVATGTNAVNFTISLPTPMRTAPTVSVTVGSFKQHLGAAAVAATGLTGNATHTPTVVGLNSTGTATAGQGAILEGGGGSGFVVASADF